MPAERQGVIFEFHIAREARDRYQFDEALFSINGNVIFANFHAARVFAQKINEKRDLVSFPEQAIRAGQLNAMGLIDEILHYTVTTYSEQASPQAMSKALAWLDRSLGAEVVDATLARFATSFPPLAVYRREQDVETYLAGSSAGVSHRAVALEELLMLWLANMNPAFSPFMELFDDKELDADSSYKQLLNGLHEFFANQPPFGPDGQNLIDMLRSPAIAVPHSLSGQLEYILSRWGYLLGSYLYRLLGSLDLIKEEEKLIFMGGDGRRGSSKGDIFSFSGQEVEYERFSQDSAWMPNVVLLAKNAFVWLDQLSRKYQREINRLDQIPDEELDQLQRWGITGLWLIGLWERSPASKRIKQIMGNPDAVASAYSLYDYTIAGDLGGQEACQRLQERAWRRGIRLASDMVPNHMGIDSPWVVNNPERFIALDYSPFPSYSFNGPDLSNDERVGIFLEDHYYDHSDAAVVFKRVDRWTGDTKYIYHGNDGTTMPWNDTAQLNYLNADVREAVIQTILHVARQFPVIRFDAAMTLAKKHYQRLWYPEPGTGGAIPSRADHGMTRDQLNQHMPEEFWREVVDRVAREVPDTLLLAEAFWLMEGYFVRTLGMHRVYNSAFMNMLRDEENANYRQLMKNTMEFDPQILKRFVNFMNNPDERTAVDQFGKGDKYMGICVLMSTLPGLPMFGHGQVEGFAEKYGMEYRWARWHEEPDVDLVRRHERELFPLLHKRYLFADAEHFRLYDFYSAEGHVNEDVFAYSNRAGNERTLVLYHNKYATARGWVRSSAAYSAKTSASGARALIQQSLSESLGLQADERHFTIFRDHVSGLEYIRNNRELREQGIYVELNAYQFHVFLDFREVRDNDWHQYGHLAGYLGGRGVPSIDEALKEIFLQPIHQPFRDLVNAESFRRLFDAAAWPAEPSGKASATPAAPVAPAEPPAIDQALLEEVEQKSLNLLRGIKQINRAGGDEQALAGEMRRRVEAILRLPAYSANPQREQLQRDPATWGTLLAWGFTHALGLISGEPEPEQQSRSWIDEWLLGKIVASVLVDLGVGEQQAWRCVAALKVLISHQRWFELPAETVERPYAVLETWLKDSEVQQFIQVNRHMGVLWFTKEPFEQLLWFMRAIAAASSSADLPEPQASETIAQHVALVEQLRQAQDESGYQLEKLLDLAHT